MHEPTDERWTGVGRAPPDGWTGARPPAFRPVPSGAAASVAPVTTGARSIDTLFTRAPGNPLLAPARWPYRVNAVMNAGATMVGDETVLLCRVEDRRGP